MTVGEKIRETRLAHGFTQRELGNLCGMADSAIRRYESNRGNPTAKTLQRIAEALGVPAYALMDEPNAKAYLHDCFWTAELEDKLGLIGYSLGFDEDNAAIWINYPDGWLEVQEDELRALDEDTNSYMAFKLEGLKEKNKSRFHAESKK